MRDATHLLGEESSMEKGPSDASGHFVTYGPVRKFGAANSIGVPKVESVWCPDVLCDSSRG